MLRWRLRAWTLALALGLAPGAALALQPGQSAPLRLYSTGDSITRAFDADLIGDNLNVSWVNGYHGFWEQLFNLPDINAHNQRIDAIYGTSGRLNTVSAQNGARVDDLFSQSTSASGQNVTYATVMLGGNDVCRDDLASLPTDAAFEADFRAGMDELLANLPSGATLQVVAIPDIKRLYDIGVDKTVLGIVDCELLWQLTVLGFPCGSMLSPSNSEADRLYVQSRNIGYNAILAAVTAEKAAAHPGKFVSFTDVSFSFAFGLDDISNIDCFHPSWEGQEKLAEGTWNAGCLGPGASCGDGLTACNEQCDDGGTVGGDGCDAACQIESCYACSGDPSVCSCDIGNFCGQLCGATGTCQEPTPGACGCDFQ